MELTTHDVPALDANDNPMRGWMVIDDHGSIEYRPGHHVGHTEPFTQIQYDNWLKHAHSSSEHWPIVGLVRPWNGGGGVDVTIEPDCGEVLMPVRTKDHDRGQGLYAAFERGHRVAGVYYPRSWTRPSTREQYQPGWEDPRC